MERNFKFAEFLLRAGLAVVFLYAAIVSILMPQNWVGFLPFWLREIIPAGILLLVFSGFEIILALWLISGFKTFLAALVAAATLFLIIAFNLSSSLLDIIFRDIAILFSALALAALNYKK